MKKKYLILIIVIVALIICLSSALAFTYFFTDTFKSNKQLFFKYISNNSEITDIFNDKALDTYFQKQTTTPYTSEGKITTNVTFPDSSNANLASALKNSSISYTGKTDKTNNYIYRNIKANYSDSSSSNFEFIKKDDIYAIKVEDCLNKFIGLKNDNLKELCTKFGVPEEISKIIPNKLNFNNGSIVNFISKKDLQSLKNKYMKIIIDNINDEMLSKDYENKSDIYTLTINYEQLKKIVYELIKSAKDDEIIINTIKKFMESYLNLPEDEISSQIDEYKKQIESMLSSIEPLDEETSDYTISNSESYVNVSNPFNRIIIKTYVQKRNLIKTDFILEYSNSSSYVLSITQTADSIRFESNFDTASKFALYIQKIKSNNEIKFDVNMAYNDEQIAQLILTYNGTNTDQVQESCELNFEMDSNLLGLSPLNVGILNTPDTTINSNTTSTSSKLKFVCNYTNSLTFGTEITKDDVPDSNIVFINSAPSGEKVINLFNKLGNRFVQANNSKVSALGLKENENPFLYYIPAIIPIEVTVCVNPSSSSLSRSIPIVISGMSFSMLRGDNGVLRRASDAEFSNILGSIDEQIKLSAMSLRTSIVSNTISKENYVATTKENIKALANDFANELGVKALKGGNSENNINPEGFTVAYYLDTVGNSTTDGQGYIVIWYTDNMLRSTTINENSLSNYNIKLPTENNTNSNDIVLAYVVQIQNYNSKLLSGVLTNTSTANLDIRKNLYSSTSLNKIVPPSQ